MDEIKQKFRLKNRQTANCLSFLNLIDVENQKVHRQINRNLENLEKFLAEICHHTHENFTYFNLSHKSTFWHIKFQKPWNVK
jgi:hypothetical protein